MPVKRSDFLKHFSQTFETTCPILTLYFFVMFKWFVLRSWVVIEKGFQTLSDAHVAVYFSKGLTIVKVVALL